MDVRRWMSGSVALVPSDTDLLDARRFLESLAVRYAMVTSEARILGVVDRFLIDATLGCESRRFSIRSSRTIRDLVKDVPPVLSPHDSIETAAAEMVNANVTVLPVVDEDHVVGVLAVTDLLRAMIDLMEPEAHTVRMVATTPPGGDLLEDLKRRSRGLAIRSLVAHPHKEGGWETMLRLSGRAGRARCG